MQKDSEIIKQLRYEYRLTQEQLAEKLGVTKGFVSLVEQGRSKISAKIKEKLVQNFQDFYKTNTIQKNSIDMLNAKFYTDVIGSCGNGAFEQSQEFEIIQMPTFIIRNYNPQREYSIITAKGNSMQNTIEDGDKLLVENFVASDSIIDNEIYVFCYDDSLYIKRLIKNIDQIIVKSDNKEIPMRYIEKENINSLHIIGKIVASVRSYFK